MKINSFLLILTIWAVLVLSEEQCDPGYNYEYYEYYDYGDGDAKDDQNARDDSDTYSDDRTDNVMYGNDRVDNGAYGDDSDISDKYADTCDYRESDTKNNQYDYDNNIDDDIYNAVSTFALNMLYKLRAKYTRDMFVISPNDIYLELAAMAEGATGDAQIELFRVLGLPENNMALRREYYSRILSSRPPLSKCSPDSGYFSTKILAIDESCFVNETWAEYARSNGLLDYVISLPLKRDPSVALENLNCITYNRLGQDINLDGNSLISTVDQSIVWKTEFPLSKIEEDAIFYNEMGQPIGTVTLMHSRNRFMIAPLEKYKSRALLLPIGEDGRYVMMFVLNCCDSLEQTALELDTIVNKEIFFKAAETEVPIDIAIPKFTVESSNMSMRYILEQVGVRKLWYDSDGSNLVSDPPAIPSALYQRIRFNVNSQGVFPYYEDDSSEGDDGCEESADSFIVNKPFLYAVVDVVTKMTITSGAYSCPV